MGILALECPNGPFTPQKTPTNRLVTTCRCAPFQLTGLWISFACPNEPDEPVILYERLQTTIARDRKKGNDEVRTGPARIKSVYFARSFWGVAS